MHERGYTFNGTANISGLTKPEADALVLGQLMHDQPNRQPGGESRKRQLRENHRQETEEMLQDVGFA